ncbi:TIGR02611 family protein [Spongisporangium articulatum]|uniref:TIGR02611 family protein n=1 Tax=Spongisporangium articulatum TaxID=3362603 RepID=A0ABW8AR52_9ACTN
MTDSHKGGTEAVSEHEDHDSDDNPLTRFGAWRESVRQRPHAYRLYRIGVGVLGGAIVIGGLILIPFPGPGWVIVFIGLAVLATEFTWAQRLERFARAQVKKWTDWVSDQSWPVRILIGLLTFASVVVVLYAVFLVIGVPGWVPDSWLDPIPDWLPKLD